MPNCNCQSLDDLVTPYIDGELADADRRAVDEHLRRCPPCQSRVAAERAVHDLCRARPTALGMTRAPEALRGACQRLASVTSRQSPVSQSSQQSTVSSQQATVERLQATGGAAALRQAQGRAEPGRAGRRLANVLAPFAMAATL